MINILLWIAVMILVFLQARRDKSLRAKLASEEYWKKSAYEKNVKLVRDKQELEKAMCEKDVEMTALKAKLKPLPKVKEINVCGKSKSRKRRNTRS